jgi:hypothetical protein
MDATQMKYEFLITYESIASAAAPGYTNREISVFLTEAQEDIVKETVALGLDMNDLTRSIVRVLRTSGKVSTNTLIGTPYRAYSFTTSTLNPTPFYSYAYTFAKTNGNVIEVKPMPEEAVIKNLKNPYKKPSNTKYWLVENNGVINIIPPTDVTISLTDELHVLYLKKPEPIIVGQLTPATAIDGVFDIKSCELDDIVQRDIIYKAAKKAFAATKDTAGYQIQNNEEKQ